MADFWDVVQGLSPLAMYECAETSGTTMVDSSGNGRNGVIDSGVQLNQAGVITGAPGGAWLLNAFEGGSVTGASWMAPATAFTAIVFFRLTSLPSATTALMARSDINGANNPSVKAWSIQVSNTGVVNGRVYNNLNASVAPSSSSGAVTANTLIMLAVSHDGTTVKYRKNGSSLIASAALGGTPVPFATNATPLTLGRDVGSSVTLNGKIQGGLFFGSALSDADLDAIWAAAATGFASLAGDVPATTGDFTASVGDTVTLAGDIAATTGAFVVDTPATELSLAADIPVTTGAFTLTEPVFDLSIDGTVPAVTGAFRVSTLSRAAAVAADSPLVWYRLDEASGSVANDSSGNGNDGTVSGTLGWGHSSLVPTDPDNDAATFNSDSVTVALTGGDDITFEGIVADEVGTGVLAVRDGYFQVIDEFIATGQRRLQVENKRSGKFISLNYGSTAGYPVAFAATFTTTDTLIYIRSGLVDAVPTDSVSSSDTYLHVPVDPDTPLVIGAGLVMVLDEIAYYDVALSLEQIRQHADLGFVLEPEMTFAGTVPSTTGEFTVTKADSVTLAATVPTTTGAFTAEILVSLELAADIPATTGAFTVTRLDTVTLTADIPATTGAFTVKHGEVTLAGAQQRVSGSFSVLVEETVSLAASIPATTGAFEMVGSYEVTVDGQIAATVAVFQIGSPPQTETGNRASGRDRRGLGIVFYEPPVTPAPVLDAVQHAYVSASAYGDVVMNGAQPVFTADRAVTKRLRTRIVLGNRDVSFFRDIPTPEPTYSLITPLGYGSASIILPQVAVPFESPGRGDLAWLTPGIRVLVQRVDEDDVVVATDYKGVVVKFGIRPDPNGGGGLEVQVGGEAAGRAALIDKQPPLFTKRNDLGFWWWGGIQELGLRFEPRLGDDFGIKLRNSGGMSHLDYLNDLSAKGVRRNGTQLTCMPDAHEDGGAYRVAAKDLETIHATVYLDDAVSVPSLDRDVAEEPNRIYATGVTPELMRVRFGAYPILRDATPPPYPFNDGSSFGVGTVDGDTDTGDGVSVMIWRLVKAGYLSLADKPGGYDSDVSDAIKDLKEDALSGFVAVDGDMTEEAWAALFDASATGYSLAGTQILPAAQLRSTKKWLRSGNGSAIARNPFYDPTVLPVDSTVDMGVGMTRKQMRAWSRGELSPATDPNWVGTITLRSGAVIAGEHNPGDALTAGDLMDARDLRNGMNVWCPQFDGGTLFHVSGIEVRGGGGLTEVALTVDTRARDTMKVWQVIRRNRDSRRNPARAWLNQHRSSALTKDAVGEFDEIGGVLDEGVRLAADAWTVFPVVAGQEGVIRSLRVAATPATEYVMAVFGKQVAPARLAELVGDPLTKAGKRRWVDEDVRATLDEDHVLLYAAGEKRAPLGYFPGAKYDPDTLGPDEDPDEFREVPDDERLTGDWEDDAGFSYHTFGAPVLWVAIFAAADSRLSPGRIMWPQLEAGS